MVVGNATRNIPLGIRVDGIDRPVLDFAGTLGEKQFTVNLGSFGVEKTVEIIAGRQEGAGGQSNVKGSYIASVKYPMGSSFTVQSPTQNNKRIVVYGDSISVGDGTTQSVYDSLIPLLRNKYGFDVMSEGYQARTFKYDVGDSTKLNNFVNRLTSYNPTIIYLQIGTNDFGLNQRNASDFGAAYTTFINSLHDSLPDVRIICQTPFDRNNKNTSNSFGNILDDYRNQIITACSNVSWATIIDGATTVSLSDMPDGLHPNTTGHAKYANAVVPYLLNPAYSITGQTTIETSATSAPFTLSLNTNSGYELPIFDGSGAIAISVSSGILSVISDGIISGNNSSSVVVIPNDTSTGFSFTYTSMGLSGEVMLTFSNNKDWIDPSSMILSIGKSLSPTPETPSTPSPSSS
jgi:lysophospholipase L1-like esterase